MTVYPAQDRLVAKEVALGTIRELPLPEDHIGLSLIAPFKNVEADDVIFEYLPQLVTGMAPARAEDAEAELAQKDDTFGIGRASVIDWALKDHYDPSDVSRFREAYLLANENPGLAVSNFPLTVQSITEGFSNRVARDTLIRRRKLDNRLEWMIMSALELGTISYNDGKIKFSVDYGRPAGQSASVTTTWNQSTADPIEDAFGVIDYMWNTYRVKMGRVICSTRVIRNILNSSKFNARSGIGIAGSSTASPTPIDPRYLIDGWGYEAARRVFENATGLTIIPYDSVYRTRAVGSLTEHVNRFVDENKMIFLPTPDSVDMVDDTIGFAATLSSPHVEGNWTPGYYEWEQETIDPWGRDAGTGIKAFPVFPHMEYTYALKVLTAAQDDPSW